MFVVSSFAFCWCFESLKTNKYIYYTPDKQFEVTQNTTKMQKMTLKTWWVIFIHISYLKLTFGIKRCKLLCLTKHFSPSLKSSREQALWSTVNVGDYRVHVSHNIIVLWTVWMVCLWLMHMMMKTLPVHFMSKRFFLSLPQCQEASHVHIQKNL